MGHHKAKQSTFPGLLALRWRSMVVLGKQDEVALGLDSQATFFTFSPVVAPCGRCN